MTSQSKWQYFLVELAHHLPFSIFGVTLGLVMMGILTFFAIIMETEHLLPAASMELFHVFHPAHVLFSAVATTAMFWKHDNQNLFKAVVVGFLGSVLICGISDIFFPFLGGLVFGVDMHLHVCIVEEPGLVFPFAIVGVLAGLMVTRTFEKSTEYSHSIHVFISSMASILYLLSFGMTEWIHSAGTVFLITIIAVMVPCCASDIAFPLACAHKYCEHKEN